MSESPEKPGYSAEAELPRQLIMWMGFPRPTGSALFKHLAMRGDDAPEWIKALIPEDDWVPPKHIRALAVYEAVLRAPASLYPREPVQNGIGLPDGWKAVPLEPTVPMMTRLMCVGLRHAEYKDFHSSPLMSEMVEGYEAMLSEAPEPPCSAAEKEASHG